MNILANMRYTICIKGRLIISSVCYYLGGDKGGGGSRQTVTKNEKGERGQKSMVGW